MNCVSAEKKEKNHIRYKPYYNNNMFGTMNVTHTAHPKKNYKIFQYIFSISHFFSFHNYKLNVTTISMLQLVLCLTCSPPFDKNFGSSLLIISTKSKVFKPFLACFSPSSLKWCFDCCFYFFVCCCDFYQFINVLYYTALVHCSFQIEWIYRMQVTGYLCPLPLVWFIRIRTSTQKLFNFLLFLILYVC